MLLIVLITLSFVSLALFVKNVSISVRWRSKEKPVSADKCFFCKVERHKETDIIQTISCFHPRGKIIEEPGDPLSCVTTCSHALIKNEKIGFEQALKFTSVTDAFVSEGFKLIASLVPTTVAVLKILEVI